MKKILVTGGAGFIGSNLCERLLNEGNKVICLDNLFTGSIDNIKHLLLNPDFEFVEHDIVDAFSEDVEQIYNLACPASPPHYQHDPIKTFKTSVIGILNMLELAQSCGARLLQASTSEVYGDPKVHPQTENYWGNVNINGVRSCYDEGKRAAETLMCDFYRQNKTDIKIIRIFNTYGPKMDINDGRVVSNFIVQALKGEDITIYGDGSQTRSFCFVDDLIEGIIRMMNTENFTGPVNLGNDSERTINEFAKNILEITASKSKLVYLPLPSDDPTQRRPDLALAAEKLNWRPKTSLHDGLLKTIEYFKLKIKD